MRVQVAGRHMDVGDALRTRITDELSAGVAKYFNRATDAMVTVEKSGPGYDVDCVVRLASGITLEVVGKGGDATIFVNGTKAVTGRIEKTQCCAYSADEGADVGADEGTPVTEVYKVPFKFTGKIDKVTIELKESKKAQ